MLVLLVVSAAYHPRILRASHFGARHRPVRLDELEAGAERARAALDAALADLVQEEAASANQPYLTPEEREQVLAETAAKRIEGDEPPPPPPPSNLVPEVDRGITLNQDAMEARLSVPVAPSPPPPLGAAPSSPSVDRVSPLEFDGNVPRQTGAKELTQKELSNYAFEGLAPPPVPPDYRRPPPPPPGAIRLVRLNGLERANFLLLIALVATGFGSSSAQVWDPALVGSLRLAASGLLLGHVAVAVFGVTLILGAPSGGDSGAAEDAAGVAAGTGEKEGLPVLWFAKLLATGPGGLLSLRRELAGE